MLMAAEISVYTCRYKHTHRNIQKKKSKVTVLSRNIPTVLLLEILNQVQLRMHFFIILNEQTHSLFQTWL